MDWGEMVSASFDLFLPDLRDKLGLAKPTNRRAEREQWSDFSAAVLYRDVSRLPELSSHLDGNGERPPGIQDGLHIHNGAEGEVQELRRRVS